MSNNNNNNKEIINKMWMENFNCLPPGRVLRRNHVQADLRLPNLVEEPIHSPTSGENYRTCMLSDKYGWKNFEVGGTSILKHNYLDLNSAVTTYSPNERVNRSHLLPHALIGNALHAHSDFVRLEKPLNPFIYDIFTWVTHSPYTFHIQGVTKPNYRVKNLKDATTPSDSKPFSIPLEAANNNKEALLEALQLRQYFGLTAPPLSYSKLSTEGHDYIYDTRRDFFALRACKDKPLSPESYGHDPLKLSSQFYLSKAPLPRKYFTEDAKKDTKLLVGHYSQDILREMMRVKGYPNYLVYDGMPLDFNVEKGRGE